MSTPRRVFAYVRVSSEEQGRHGTSLDAQRDEVRAFCERERWPVPRIFEEVQSGGAEKLSERVELKRLLEEVQSGDAVLVAKVDRWGRDLPHVVASVRDLVRRGVRWISVGESIDATTQQGDSTLGIMSWVADAERKRIRDRTVGRRRQLRDQGCWTEGRPPFGYVRDPHTRRLVIRQAEAVVVLEVFKRCTMGESIERIARVLAARGISRVDGPPVKWDKKAVHHMLTRREYLGEVRRTDGRYEPAHPPIVAAGVFAEAQHALLGRRLGGRTHSAESRTSHWLLRGLARCASCGARMSAAYGRLGVGDGYYACAARTRGEDCDEPYARVRTTDAKIAGLILARLEQLRELLADADLGAPTTDASRLEALRRTLGSLHQRRERLVTLHVEGVLSREDFDTRRTKLEQERLSVEREIADEERKLSPITDEIRASALREIRTLRRGWERTTPAERREILALIAEGVTLENGEPRITWASTSAVCAATVGRNLFPGTADT